MDLYRIAIALSMTSNHMGVLGALSAHLFRVGGHVDQLHEKFGRLQVAIGGAFGATIGIEMLHNVGKLIEKTQTYSHELTKLQGLGGDMAKAVLSGEVENIAFTVSRHIGVSPVEVMKMMGMGYSIFGNEALSIAMAENMARTSFVLQSAGDFKGADPGEQMQKLMRGAEISGHLGVPGQPSDPKIAQHYFDLATQAVYATHGMVTPATLLNMAQQGGAFMRGLSDQGFMTQAIMAQAMGGHRAGTAYMSLYQQLAGGHMTQASARGMEKLGLLSPGEWRKGSGFGVILSDIASKRLAGQLGHDPLDLIQAIMKRQEALGVTDPMEIARKLTMAIGRQTGQRYTAEMVLNMQQMLAERERMGQAWGVAANFEGMMRTDVAANLRALTAAWDRFTQALAGPLTQTTISALDSMRGALLSLGDWAREHPELVQKLAVGFTALGAALTVLGSAAVLGALVTLSGTGGLLFALAAGIVALSEAAKVGTDQPSFLQSVRDLPQNYAGFTSFVENLGPKISTAFATIAAFFQNEIMGLPGKLLGAINAAFSSIQDMITRALSGTISRRAIVGPDRGFAGPGGPPAGFRLNQPSRSFDLFNSPLTAPGGASLGGPSFASAISTGKGPTPINVSVKLDIDGRTLAEMMSQKLADLFEFPGQYPGYNGMAGHTPGDFPGVST
jgi:hypothetical protein